MHSVLLSVMFLSAAATAPTTSAAAAPDAVFLDDKVERHSLVAHDDAPPVYVAEGKPKKKRGTKKARGANAGFRFGALPIGAKGVSPQGRQLGIGLQLGFPTALTLKYMLTGDQGIVGGIGVGTGWIAQALSLHLDYHYHPHTLVLGPPIKVSWYFGGGLWLGIAERSVNPWFGINYANFFYGPVHVWLGLRAPIGVQMAFRELPFEIYVEGVPALVLFPSIGFGIGATIGARFYF